MKPATCFLIAFISLFSQKGYTQRNYVKGFIIGLPFQSGAVIANAGFEHLTTTKKASWQLSINFAAGQLGNDADHRRADGF